MKALTIWQPWASLIAWGEKQWETRSWTTTHRGPLAIHAGLDSVTVELFESNTFYRQAFERARVDLSRILPAGRILCIVDLTDIQRTEEIKPWLSQSEQEFGDYSHGRYAWHFENVRVLPYPIPEVGKQGLWNWQVELESLKFLEV